MNRMTEPQWLTWALDQARRDLIDLTRRNRLLHAPLGGKRPWCMAIIGHSPDELFEKLYRQEDFRGYSFKAREAEPDTQQSLAIVSTVHPRQFSLSQKRQQRWRWSMIVCGKRDSVRSAWRFTVEKQINATF
jgi:hypothetical protein